MQTFTPKDERAEQAARVRSMLQRWSREVEGSEPDWSVDDIEPLALLREVQTDAQLHRLVLDTGR